MSRMPTDTTRINCDAGVIRVVFNEETGGEKLVNTPYCG